MNFVTREVVTTVEIPIYGLAHSPATDAELELALENAMTAVMGSGEDGATSSRLVLSVHRVYRNELIP